MLNNINIEDRYVLELSLAMLYLGEGSKSGHTSMGNTNPIILKFFVRSLLILYDLDKSSLKCVLHLRIDQNETELKEFWSNELGIPVTNFSFVKDKRSVKSKTYPSYKGVCVVECGRVAILRRLNFINQSFCGKILE